MRRLELAVLVLMVGSVAAKAAPLSQAPMCQGDGSRVALLVGNQDYSSPIKPLDNPGHDVDLFGPLLCRNGFSVYRYKDLGIDDFDAAIDTFASATHGAKTALLYYSGHGFAVGRKNWLVPTDARLKCEDVAAEDAVSPRISRRLVDLDDQVFARLDPNVDQIVILDACRTDPIKGCRGGISPSFVKGLGRSHNAAGRLVVYATQDGQVALDAIDGSANSPLMTALQQRLAAAPKRNWVDAMLDVSQEVAKLTRQNQLPNLDISLPPQGCLAADCTPDPVPPLQDPEQQAFVAAMEQNKVASFDAFLAQYPTGRLAQIAHRERDKIAGVSGAAESPVASNRPTEVESSPVKTETILPDLIAPPTEFPIAAPEPVHQSKHQFDSAEVATCDRLAASPLDDSLPSGVSAVEFDQIDASQAIPACRSALAIDPTNVRLMNELARALVKSGDYSGARKLYLAAAELHSALGMNSLATMYELGQGQSRDYSTAIFWYRRAADAGSIAAKNNLGRMYELGQGVAAPDFDQAFYWYREAANAGNIDAIHNMRRMYAAGLDDSKVFGGSWRQTYGEGRVPSYEGDHAQAASTAPSLPTESAAPVKPVPTSQEVFSTDPSPAIATHQRAALLVEEPEDPAKVKTYIGNVTWTSESISPGQGKPLTQAIKASVDIPEAKLKMTMVMQKNFEIQFPASHTIEFRFQAERSSRLGVIKQINVPDMRRDDEAQTGSPLTGVPVSITDNYFLVGLTRGAAESTNLRMMSASNWFDLTVLFASGKVGKVTFEKGALGARIMADVIKFWQSSNDAPNSVRIVANPTK